MYGIGIKFTTTPAVQIAKIHPGSVAEKQGKLKIGDTILSISPNNDAEEIEAYGMPIHRFIQLVLGKKGSILRLKVQHFDLSFEEIEIQRDSAF